MAKIKNFNIKKLRTEEDFGFQKRIEAETALLTVQTDKPMVAAYKAALTAFDDALKGSTSNSLSSTVTRADEMADAAWSGLNAQTKAMLGHPVEALRTVAAEASALIAKYGNPTWPTTKSTVVCTISCKTSPPSVSRSRNKSISTLGSPNFRPAVTSSLPPLPPVMPKPPFASPAL